MTDLPLLGQLEDAAAVAPPPMPVSAIPMAVPLQWEMGKLTDQEGNKLNAITFHQPNSKTHVVMADEDARAFVTALQQMISGLTIAKVAP